MDTYWLLDKSYGGSSKVKEDNSDTLMTGQMSSHQDQMISPIDTTMSGQGMNSPIQRRKRNSNEEARSKGMYRVDESNDHDGGETT